MGKIMPSKCQWMATNRIKTRLPFNNLFPVDDKTVEAVAEHMKANGYDQSQPIVLWKEKLDEDDNQAIIVDGHTRLLAAKKIRLSPVYVARVSFASDEAALEYAIHNQRDRRNLTDADLLRCIEAVDERKPRGGDRKSEAVKSKASSEAIDLGKSAEETAKIVGTSKTKVEKARTVLDRADEQTKQTVLDGKKSIYAAAKETREKRLSREERKKEGEESRRAKEEVLGGPLGIKLYKLIGQINVLAGIINRCIVELRKQDAVRIEGLQGTLLPPAMVRLLATIREFGPYLGVGVSVSESQGEIKEDSKAVVELPSSSSARIKRVWEIAHVMSDSHGLLTAVKPIVKQYCKHPLATEENALVFDHFLHWANEWKLVLDNILMAKTESEPETIVPEAPEVTTKDFQKKVVESDVPALVYFSFSDYEHYEANKAEYSEAQRKRGEVCSM